MSEEQMSVKCGYENPILVTLSLYFFTIFRRDVFSGVDEEELQRSLYDSDGCYNSSLFQSSSVSKKIKIPPE